MILDGFAGPGGWAEGLRLLGLTEVGLEWDTAACRTRVAAGHRMTIRTDIAAYPTAPFAGRVKVKVDSPPCQAWSRAGKGLGLVDQPLVHQAVADLAAGRDTRADLLAACRDPRSLLAAEPMRWHHDLRPETILMEEVPDVLPLWKQYAQILRGWGYSAWCGELNAADYGVPQTRRRAILIASRVRDVTAPTATHTERPQGDNLFGPGLRPWVSTADALDLTGPHLIVSNYGDPTTPSGRGERPSTEPAWTVTSKLSRVKLLAPDGSSVRLASRDAGVLQSFHRDYPWQGTKSAQDEQIGNAVPPLLAAHVAAAGLGLDISEALAAQAAGAAA
jgi:DNA (cytosine-5)-methyltransferase 1